MTVPSNSLAMWPFHSLTKAVNLSANIDAQAVTWVALLPAWPRNRGIHTQSNIQKDRYMFPSVICVTPCRLSQPLPPRWETDGACEPPAAALHSGLGHTACGLGGRGAPSVTGGASALLGRGSRQHCHCG